MQSAYKGFGLVPYSRNPKQQNDVKGDLNRLFPIRMVLVFTADATIDSIAHVSNLVPQMRNLPLTILINNVGGTEGLIANDFKNIRTNLSKRD